GYNNAPSAAQFDFSSAPSPASTQPKNFFRVPPMPASLAGNTNYNGEQPPASSVAFTTPSQPGVPATGPMKYSQFGAPSYGAPQASQSFAPPASGAPSQPPYGAPATGPMGQFPLNSPSPNQPGMSLPGIPAGPVGLDFKEASSRGPKPWLIVVVVILLFAIIGGSVAGYLYLHRNKGTQATQRIQTQPPASVVQPKGPVLFADTFTDNHNGWSLQSYPGKFSMAIAAGSLALESDNNELLWEMLPGNKTFSDFTLTCDTVLSKGDQDNGYGIYIRGSSMQNTDLATYYRFELYGDGSYAIFKGTISANGTTSSTILVNYTLHPAIQKQGGLNHMMITAKGSVLSLTVNGQLLKTVTDNNYSSGSIALFVSNLKNAKPGAQAKFSNLHIYGV
ncbi:MAG: DUF1080 domain-containing protein, partial [Chloroflexota bacterium]|nr:DUF1080 domain-containing protein [Chloroflexota bacterium]